MRNGDKRWWDDKCKAARQMLLFDAQDVGRSRAASIFGEAKAVNWDFGCFHGSISVCSGYVDSLKWE